MYWPEVDFKFSDIAKFGPLLAQKRQNWGKFFYLQTPKKGVYWPFLALILGTPSQALKIVTVLGCLERVYQVSRPGKANQPLFWAFSVKRMILYNININLNTNKRESPLTFVTYLLSGKCTDRDICYVNRTAILSTSGWWTWIFEFLHHDRSNARKNQRN